MTYKATFAPEKESILAVYLEGKIELEFLTTISSIPLIYASSDSVFDFARARAWFEAKDLPEQATKISQLIARIGSAHSLELLLTGKSIDSSEALRIGLINDLCTREEFDERIAKIAELSTSAIELAVGLTRRATRLSNEQAEMLERYAFALRFTHPDQQEGMRAFLEKRLPNFKKF